MALARQHSKKIPKPQFAATVKMGLKFETLDRWRRNPLDYFVERLGVKRETIDWTLLKEYQNHSWDGTLNPLVSICSAIAQWKWVGVESGTGVGKTYLAACLTFWFLECFADAIVITTAPKEKQLSLHIWKEIGLLFPQFGKGDLQNLKLRMNPPLDAWVAVGFVAGTKAHEESATKAQGFHAEHMLVIVEETPGVPSATLTALQNSCIAPHNLILALGNPDHQLDTLHKFCGLPNVMHIRISGMDHPNVILDNPLFVPGAQTKKGLERLLERYGSADNPLYLSRARGISPKSEFNSLIHVEWCYEAISRGKEIQNGGDGIRALGVDVANSESGDKAAIAYGSNEHLQKVDDFPCPNSNHLGEVVWRIMQDDSIAPESVGVDGVGVGAGTVNKLKELGAGIQNLMGAPVKLYRDEVLMEEKFISLRAQMYWQMREDLRRGLITLPNDDELIADLTTPKWFTRNGKIHVEPKEDLVKRLGHSPNKGDAAVYWNWVRQTINAPAMAMESEEVPMSILNAERHRTW